MLIVSIMFILVAVVAVKLATTWDWKTWGIYAGATAIACLLVSGLSYLVGTRQDYFSEVWNYKATAVRYYERWNERVHCRHPHYVTKTRTVTKTDSKGRSYRTTETYREQDGYEHMYDVDNHPARWERLNEYGEEQSIDESEYSRWMRTWGNNQFVDMHRKYHTINGNMYESRWNNQFDTIYPVEVVKSYENRVRVSNSVFNYGPVSKEAAKKYYRPADKGITSAVLSYDGTPFLDGEDMMIRRVNASLGPSSRIHVIILLWDATQTSSEEMNNVLAAWKGPNKNELVVAIGLNKDRTVRWCQCYSWVDDTTIHAKVRQDVLAMNTLDFGKLRDSLMKQVPSHWKKKDFRDFSYLQTSLPWWAYLMAVVLNAGACVGIYFIVLNVMKSGQVPFVPALGHWR